MRGKENLKFLKFIYVFANRLTVLDEDKIGFDQIGEYRLPLKDIDIDDLNDFDVKLENIKEVFNRDFRFLIYHIYSIIRTNASSLKKKNFVFRVQIIFDIE